MKRYRRNVAAVIFDESRNRVLMFHRADLRKKSWQFPQGGVDPGESEEQAVLRELKEEIGSNDVTILRQSAKRTRYRFPKSVRLQMQKKRKWRDYVGQEQRWFLVRLNHDTDELSLKNEGYQQEFNDFRWMSPRQGLRKVVGFKQKAYRKGLKRLGVI